MTTYTSIPENMKTLIRNLGFTLGLNRERGLYITHNEYPHYPQVKQSDNTLTATIDKVKTLNFTVEKSNNYPYLTSLSLEEKDTYFSVDNKHSQTQIKLFKNYDGYEFSLEVNLLKDGTIEIETGEKDSFSCLNGMTLSKTASEIIKYLNDVDARLISFIEYFATLYPELSKTFYHLKTESYKRERRIA